MTTTRPTPAAQANAAFGHWAEQVAAEHLTAAGWRLLASNFRLRGGELDLVFRAGATVVVVEVKQRSSAAYGYPAESIDRRKLARLRATAHYYVNFVLREPDASMRLDAVLVLGTRERHSIEHLKDVG